MTLVSIIIPTYNRAHLISETLDSIIAQTHTNWECIIVDDGSTDNTESVVKKYILKDTRFKFYNRPKDRTKGANACRNYGFKISKGEYINWFDSDDLMKPKKIECQIELLVNNTTIDFCIDRFDNFDESLNFYEEDAFNKNIINTFNLSNYILHNVFWGTINFVSKREVCENISFDEILKSGQEYNFFIAFFASNKNLKGKFIDKVLTYRRIHSNSIQQLQKKNRVIRIENKFMVYWQSYKMYNKKLNAIESKFLLLNTCLFYQRLLMQRQQKPATKVIFFELRKQIGIIKAIEIIAILKLSYITKKGDDAGGKLIRKVFN